MGITGKPIHAVHKDCLCICAIKKAFFFPSKHMASLDLLISQLNRKPNKCTN